MRIGIDLDDVLCDFISAFTEIAHDLFGIDKNIRPNDWEWSNYAITEEQKAAVWKEIVNTYNFWEDLNVKEGASLRSMLDLRLLPNVDLVFITARAKTAGQSVQRQSAHWLEKRMCLPYPTVIVDTNKGPIAAALKLDYFIDDRPSNCLEIMQAVPGCKVFLKNSSHNLSYQAPPELERVRDFDEFVRRVLSAKT